MLRISARPSADPALSALLANHPGVTLGPAQDQAALEFVQGDWARRVLVGRSDVLSGLVELCDNNPLVCADEFSVPDPASTLALIALGPLIRGAMLIEAPALVFSFAEIDPELVEAFLRGFGWEGGARFASAAENLDSVLALRAICLVATSSAETSDIDDIYEEAYGRSFYVRRDEASEWHVNLVHGQPHAAFRLSITLGEPHSLLTVEVMADRDGKCGAAQAVHALNVMAGFEESLGL